MLRQVLKLKPLQWNINLFNKHYILNNTVKLHLQIFKNNLHCTHIICAQPAASQNPFNLPEKEFLIKVKDDPDVFGDGTQEVDPVYSDDEKEEQFLSEKPLGQKMSTKQYADIIKDFLRKRRIKEAIDVLEVRMLKEDRVKPENYIYNLLIGGCGRVGYTKKAFALYNEMKKRGLKVTPGTYTALFNACSNSPWPTTDGLTRAKHLREIMIEKGYEPNLTNYNAMIKAFGRGGDLETAFALVDEVAAKKFAIRDDTLNFLLQACITDKEAGFRHALLVWQKFIKKRVTPSVYSYNLMLRCIRDCGLGDVETATDVINKLVAKKDETIRPKAIEEEELTFKTIQQKENAENSTTEHKVKLVTSKDNKIEPLREEFALVNRPNLMAKVPHLGNIISLTEVTKPEDRLLLVGGSNEFLQNMLDNKCTPNVKTFTQLLDNIPSTVAVEKDLLRNLKKHNVKPDLDFFNMLIKKRSMRFDYENAKEVLTMINTAHYQPNLITFGVLALGCKTFEDAQSLLTEMSEAKYRINIEILGAMLTQACYHNNIPYIIYIMDTCKVEEIEPSTRFVRKLYDFLKKAKTVSNDRNNAANTKTFQKDFREFKMKYRCWLNEMPIKDEEVHPWQQYRQQTDTNVKHYKDKQLNTRFKPTRASLFKQKTRTKVAK